MRKNTHLILFLLLICSLGQAQVAEKSFGIGLMAGSVMGTELCYQQGVTNSSMADIKLGFATMNSTKYLRTSFNYDFVFPAEQNLNLYAGPGITTGYFFVPGAAENEDFHGAILNLTANIGAEYMFEFPLKISFVLKPELNLLGRGGETTGELMFSYYFN